MRDVPGHRKYHRKSRQGCSTCKKRHLKCDELGPPCANCRVRKFECKYEPTGQPSKALLTPQDSPSESACVVTGSSRKAELELFLQWSTDTYRSMVFNHVNESLWQVTIPRLALEQDYLLNAMLALSSLHLASLSGPKKSISYQLAALRYHNLAFAAFQSDDRVATLETHQSLFAFSIINLVLAVAVPSWLDCGIDDTKSILDNISTMFSLLQGTTSIFRIARSWLLEGPFGDFVRSNDSMRTYRQDQSRLGENVERLRSFRDEEYAAASSTSALEAVRTFEMTTNAIESLETCFAIQHEDKMVVCFRWLAILDEDFTRRIRRREPLALLITMHWAVLLDGLSREKWWAKSSGKVLVAEISRILCSTNPEWISVISNVQQEVGLPSLQAA